MPLDLCADRVPGGRPRTLIPVSRRATTSTLATLPRASQHPLRCTPKLPPTRF